MLHEKPKQSCFTAGAATRCALLVALIVAAAPHAEAQGFYRAPTVEESIASETSRLLSGLTLAPTSIERIKGMIRAYEVSRRSLRPPADRVRIVADSIKAVRDSSIRALLPTAADSARFAENLRSRSPRPSR
ncbi:MAG: hypothetical protein LCH84_06300 [Gemmatimonadetes bacterium]|nr:hypothetical protein [Gemmatimonadota bacterium]